MWQILIATLACSLAFAAPASAHTDHKKKPAEAARIVASPQQGAQGLEAGANHAGMGEMMEEMAKDRSNMSTLERALDWLGRTHPVIVHFPIAFFPAALFTAFVGRRRPAFAKPVQFLVVAGGIIAPIAALFGWFGAGFDFATDDALLQVHRWLGTGIGIGALGLAIWALRKPEEDRGLGMILGLAAISAAIVVQGWYGGALVHGMAHMNW